MKHTPLMAQCPLLVAQIEKKAGLQIAHALLMWSFVFMNLATDATARPREPAVLFEHQRGGWKHGFRSGQPG